jgi:hypothetical protein
VLCCFAERVHNPRLPRCNNPHYGSLRGSWPLRIAPLGDWRVHNTPRLIRRYQSGSFARNARSRQVGQEESPQRWSGATREKHDRTVLGIEGIGWFLAPLPPRAQTQGRWLSPDPFSSRRRTPTVLLVPRRRASQTTTPRQAQVGDRGHRRVPAASPLAVHPVSPTPTPQRTSHRANPSPRWRRRPARRGEPGCAPGRRDLQTRIHGYPSSAVIRMLQFGPVFPEPTAH